MEAALADAYRCSGGPVPDKGLVSGRGAFLVRTVRLGGPRVRKARRNFADPLERGDMFMYLDASRFKAVVDVLRAVIRDGLLWFGLLSSQFTMGSFGLGGFFPVTLQDFGMARSGGLGFGCRLLRASIVGCRILFME